MIKCWLWTGILLVASMVITGGITRLTGSGLSIVRWDLVSGIVPPLTGQEWEEAFARYRSFPEYRMLNPSMDLAGFKKIFWWEYVHRLIGRIIGIIFIVPFVFFLIRKALTPWLIRRLALIVCIGAIQAVMGWIMVRSGLVDVPHVSHYRLAAHLSLALLLIGVILWTIMQVDRNTPWLKQKPQNAVPYLCLLALVLQIAAGALVAGLKAGLSYNTFPLMGNEWLPSHVLHSEQNILNNGVALQFVHRWFAWVVAVMMILLWRQTRSSTYHSSVRLYANLLLLATVCQIAAGIVALVLRVPVILGVVHQLLAVILFGLTVVVIFLLRYEGDGRGRVSLPFGDADTLVSASRHNSAH